ncbi:fibronectin type III domain-containing protein [Marinimicrobium sp. LS-A18]|uniref:fibronectin type III domain-containing protein n=1 Tax=Marinimicrobium sp. LS-A18 TaxID=1381596 RepID=UPI000464CD11|nr:fibronectin type III domain-containing protein [Marinimicrobium sp. LS-A18]
MQTRVGFTSFISVIGRLKLPLLCLVVSGALTACGGGSATGETTNRLESKAPETTDSQPDTDTPSDEDSQADAPAPSETDDSVDDQPVGDDEADAEGSGDSVDDGTDDDSSGGSEDDGSTAEDDDATAEGDTDSGSSDENLSEVSGLVRLEWDAPQSRENGEYLELYEIGGYELRYRKAGDSEYEVIPVEDGATESHEFDDLSGQYEFSIAAYDTNGLYSEFVNLSPVPSN